MRTIKFMLHTSSSGKKSSEEAEKDRFQRLLLEVPEELEAEKERFQRLLLELPEEDRKISFGLVTNAITCMFSHAPAFGRTPGLRPDTFFF